MAAQRAAEDPWPPGGGGGAPVTAARWCCWPKGSDGRAGPSSFLGRHCQQQGHPWVGGDPKEKKSRKPKLHLAPRVLTDTALGA